MKHFNKITIIGVGLMGGSIGLAIKKRGLAREVTGVFRRGRRMKTALSRGAVDKGVMNIADGVRDADLIILAGPVSMIPALASDVILFAKKGAIITDVGSTKTWIVNWIEKGLKRSKSIFFVGSHPMAGSEQTGVEYARADLFEGAPCIVTKTKNTNKAAFNRVSAFWSSLGANVDTMDPGRHDKVVALISHLPHLVAFSLAGAVPGESIKYAAEGFKDTTRVASSDPRLWADIFITNRKEVIKACRIFEKYYKGIIKRLSKGRFTEMISMLEAAKEKRDKHIYGD